MWSCNAVEWSFNAVDARVVTRSGRRGADLARVIGQSPSWMGAFFVCDTPAGEFPGPNQMRGCMNNARIAAVLTWVYSAGFGLPTIPVAIFLLRQGRLPVFAGLFETYGGPWSERFQPRTSTGLLMAFLVVTLVVAWAAWLLWNGSKAGGVLALVLLPVEAVFWVGFALPIPWLIGVVRVAYIALAWKALG